MGSPSDKLKRAGAIYDERQALYGANYNRIGKALSAFFPDGVELASAKDFSRYHVFTLLVAKLGRYANNWSKGHPDSIEDLITYAAILASLDDELGGKDGVVED